MDIVCVGAVVVRVGVFGQNAASNEKEGWALGDNAAECDKPLQEANHFRVEIRAVT